MSVLSCELAGLYAIVDRASIQKPVEYLSELLDAGVRLVQYRAKDGVDREILRAMHRLTRAADAVLIVNDDLDALDDADGVHLGQDDLALLDRDVRTFVGGKILGISAGDRTELERALLARPDYLGVGPFRVSASKHDAGPAIGAEGLRSLASMTTLPVAAIGGIRLEDLPTIAATGACMPAVISALADSPNPGATAQNFIGEWNRVLGDRPRG
ncbi:MAG TPA: thiamine phosphate synthase [Candidatus Baltobacteraceae bacterium]|nr:thiamine phosphate synthase [Candidatus Baltobacteraceae bacterium]